ncbi:hypothetical protein CFAL_03915 [Corynebacterium falsenii DSM 44353]|uniref:hypothetical protein n=1 Tax=Corynebacterium falsenii TaxID=108486 RepID=UPI0003E96907|nr:hypothetical protein [Corynebacterium falsenii]AHI04260.1 hypothetical protein CFAL_03915 [Corynebacterium falsenii DSM 44353]UBI05636.1 hypothetical protein LA343_05825 [Corynebacterium falsenii]
MSHSSSRHLLLMAAPALVTWIVLVAFGASPLLAVAYALLLACPVHMLMMVLMPSHQHQPAAVPAVPADARHAGHGTGRRSCH